MATVYRKAKLGAEDIHFDDEGTGSTVQTPKSDGTYRTVRRLNAVHIPTTTAIRTLSTTAINVCQAIIELWALVLARLPKAGGTMTGAIAMGTNKITGLATGTNNGDALCEGQEDNTTIEIAAGVIKVKDAGISAAKLAADAVETAKIKDLNVTTGKIALLAVQAAQIANATITAAKLTWVPGFYPFFAGQVTVPNATGPMDLAVVNLLATDILSVVVRTAPTNAVTIVKATATAGNINFTWSGAPGSAATIDVVATRAI